LKELLMVDEDDCWLEKVVVEEVFFFGEIE